MTAYEKPEMVWLGKAEVLVECQGGFGAEMASFYPGCFAEDE